MDLTVFLCYRREDSAAAAGRLYDTLCASLGEGNVFMDVATIRPGQEFPDVIARTVRRCQAFVVVIGPRWLERRAADGARRIDDPDDYVRFELEQAVASGRPIFPVLVDGGVMPGSQELPPSIRPLARWQAVEISATRYKYDTGVLVRALQQAGTPAGAQPGERRDASAAAPVRPSRPAAADASSSGAGDSQGSGAEEEQEVPRRRRFRVLPALLAVVAVVAGGGLVLRAQFAEDPQWQDLPPAPQAFEGAGVTVHEGRLWVAGGVSTAEGVPGIGRPHLDTVSVYDPGTETWTAGPPLPEPIAFAPLVVADGRLHLVGGQVRDGADDRGPVASVLRLDEESGTWVEEAPLPEARARGDAVWDGGRIVYGGGVDEHLVPSDAVFAMEDGVWRQVQSLSAAREKVAAATDGSGRVWFMGGRNKHTLDPPHSTVDVLQDTGEFFVTDLASPVHSAAGVWHAQTGPCVIGGFTSAGVTGDVECLREGTTVPPLPLARAGSGAAVLRERLHVVGGYGAGFHGTSSLQALRVDGP